LAFLAEAIKDTVRPDYAVETIYDELELQNRASIEARYGEGPNYSVAYSPSGMDRRNYNWAGIIMAAHSYQYQACEHDDWETTRAHEWTTDLALAAGFSLAREQVAGHPEPNFWAL
jgi:hypothetical protein